MGAERNYGRFYCLLKKLPFADKETLVAQYTNGRTTHLHEMSVSEYDCICDAMERMLCNDERERALRDALRRARSRALHQLQLYGIDTTDWYRVNAFCCDPRIAGKDFIELDGEELDALTRKMRVISKKKVSSAVISGCKPALVVYPVVNLNECDKS